MKEGTIRAELSKILWTSQPEELLEYEVIYVDRMMPSGLGSLNLGQNAKVLSDRILIDDRVIPLHRVVEVRKGGEVIWKRKRNALGRGLKG